MPEPMDALPSSITKLPIQGALQMGGIDQLFKQGMQDYSSAGIEQNIHNQLQQNIVPSIAERFTAGTGGSRYSPAFASQVGQAAGQAAGGPLAALKYEHGLNALKLGLTPQNEYLYKEPPLSFKDAFLGNLATNAGQAIPGLASKGAEYLANRFMGQQPQQGAAQTLASSLAAPAGQAAGQSAVQALQGSATPAVQAEQAAKTAVENQTAQQLSQAAATGATGATAGAVGTAGATGAGTAVTALQAAGAASVAPLAVALGVPLALASAGLIGVHAYEYYRDLMKSRFGTSIPPLPTNFNELPGPQRAETQLGRQLTTPQGQISHESIEGLEREFGIKANGKVPWEQRWQNITDKISGLESASGITPNEKIPWIQRYRNAQARKGK